MSSFNPVLRVGEHVVEARRLHDRRCPGGLSGPGAVGLLEGLRIPQPERRAKQYPHEWSGGMLQRGAIAARRQLPRACCWRTSPRLPRRLPGHGRGAGPAGASAGPGGVLVLITHQLGLAAQVADRVAVMYAGRLVEIGPARRVLGDPRHPTRAPSWRSLPALGAGLPVLPGGEPRPLAPRPPAAPSAPAAPWPSRSAPPAWPGAGGRGGLPVTAATAGTSKGGPVTATGLAGGIGSPAAGAGVGSAVLRPQDVTVRYGPTTALDGVSLEVGAGGAPGPGGDSGCGKTTPLRRRGYRVPTAGRGGRRSALLGLLLW